MRAPKYQPNQVGAAATTTARFRPADNGGGAVGAVGRGLQQLGDAGSQFAITQDNINRQNDDTQSRKLAAEAGVELDALAVEYGTLSAGVAREGQDEYSKRANEIRDRAIKSADNERMRGFIEERLISPHGQTVSRITGHALREAQKERVSAFQVQEESLVQQAIGSEGLGLRDARIAEAVAVRHELLEEQGFIKEDSPDAFALAGREVSDKVHDAVLDRMLAVPEPSVDEIFGYVEAYGDEMMEETVSLHLARIQSPLQKRSARAGADAVMAMLGVGEAEPATEQEFSYVTPVKGSVPSGGRFHSDRDGGNRQHRALDISAAEGTPIYTIAPGTVTKVVPMDGASGNWVEVTHPDGTSSTYSHMQGFDVKKGDAIAAGAQIGRVGNTGKGTGPHLHLVVRDAKGNRVDPEGILGSSSSGSYSSAPREWDRAEAEERLAILAEREGWNPEQTDRVRSELNQRINRDEGLLREKQADADDAAAEIMLERGEGLTSTNMIPAEVWENMSVSARARAESVVKRNNAPASPTANSDAAISLNLMQYYEPERFKQMDLSQYVGTLTKGEIESALVKQAKMRTSSGSEFSPRTGIVTALNFESKLSPDLDLDKSDEAAILQIMESEARALYAKNGGKKLTDDEYRALFRSATREIKTTPNTFMGINISGRTAVPRYELELDNMPADQRVQLETQFQNTMGRAPTDEELLRLFRAQAR